MDTTGAALRPSQLLWHFTEVLPHAISSPDDSSCKSSTPASKPSVPTVMLWTQQQLLCVTTAAGAAVRSELQQAHQQCSTHASLEKLRLCSPSAGLYSSCTVLL